MKEKWKEGSDARFQGKQQRNSCCCCIWTVFLSGTLCLKLNEKTEGRDIVNNNNSNDEECVGDIACEQLGVVVTVRQLERRSN